MASSLCDGSALIKSLLGGITPGSAKVGEERVAGPLPTKKILLTQKQMLDSDSSLPEDLPVWFGWGDWMCTVGHY